MTIRETLVKEILSMIDKDEKSRDWQMQRVIFDLGALIKEREDIAIKSNGHIK